MKKQITTFLILVLSCSSCKNNEQTKVDELKKQLIESIDPNMKMEFSQEIFQYVYEYSQGESNQMLGIKIIDKKTIQFHVVTKTHNCFVEYWVVAKNKNWDKDREMDEVDDEGYFVDEYFKEEEEYSIGVRLAKDFTKAKIKFIQKDNLETDCLPITDKIMKRIK